MSRSTETAVSRTRVARRARRWPLMGQAARLAAALALLVGVGQTVFAQTGEVPLARVLPSTTVLALFAQPGEASTAVLEDLVAELDLDEAKETLRKLGVVLGSAADEALGFSGDLSDTDEMLGHLTASCPALGDLVDDSDPDRLMGRAAVGVSMSSFNPMPTMVATVRPSDADLAVRLFEALTACYDSGVAMSEGDTPFYVLGDGSDFPVVVARVDGTLLAASDPDVLRGMVRRAAGASEPGLSGTRVGSLAGSMINRGLAMTLDLAGLANVLASFVPMLGGDSEQTLLLDRVLATMNTINGVAASFALDEAGLVIDTVVTIDEEAAVAAGEMELLDLLGCAGCEGAEPALIPAGAASLSRSSFSLQAFVAWLDTWLADVGPMVGEDLSVAGLVEEFLGVDVGALALDWLGTTWHVAQLEVYDTDAVAWLQGPGNVTVVPVASEAAARAGLELWADALTNASGLFWSLMDDADVDEVALYDGLDLASTISVRPVTYRGIEYDRVRTPVTGDYGIAVFAGHLVTSQPASAMQAVIDVHLGGASVLDDAVLGRLVPSQPDAPAGYEIVDLPRYLNGLARLTDLAAGPFASTLFVAAQVAYEESLEGTGPGDEASGDEAADGDASGDEAAGASDEDLDPADLPTFDELIGLADLATQALELLAAHTGLAIGSSEVIDGVYWSTLRVPLR